MNRRHDDWESDINTRLLARLRDELAGIDRLIKDKENALVTMKLRRKLLIDVIDDLERYIRDRGDGSEHNGDQA